MTHRAPPRTPLAYLAVGLLALLVAATPGLGHAQGAPTQKPPLHAQHWLAITGKPLAATAGARMFERGGNAVDSACAMLAATATMWDVLSWGGETQALIWHPGERRVIAINALGVAPSGATVEFYKSRGMAQPPEFGPLAAVTPGTPGGLFVMLAEYGRLSLAEVLAPAIALADGYPIEAQTANLIERDKDLLKQWPDSARVLLPHAGQPREAPRAGEIFRQPDLAATLRRFVEAERRARARGASRKAAIMAAYELFYRGPLGAEFAAAVQAQGGLITQEDLANWRVTIEASRSTTYRGIEVHKLDTWVQGPVLLQTLNILENVDLKAMGYNSARYLHTLYQAMNLAYADRDFYYGDPAFPPSEPIRGLLSKDYAKLRAAQLAVERNDPGVGPGDPYPFQDETHPFTHLLQQRQRDAAQPAGKGGRFDPRTAQHAPDVDAEQRRPSFYRGTTTVVAADREGWLVSMTPSGGWLPAVIAGRTGIGLSQRMQSFVLDASRNPYNVLEPGKRPRATLTPSLALKDGKPWLAFAVQGGDAQDQNLLQFFLNVVEFGMTPQQAAEAPNMNSFQMHDSFGDHRREPGRMLLQSATPPWLRSELGGRGYRLEFQERTSGPINAILVDHEQGSLWGASSHHGEDYGIGW
jgi:gamma-glutamyltranspeptidase / glutathione hydrolase